MKANIIKSSFQTLTVVSMLALSQASYAEVAASGSYTVDPAHTSVNFTVSHLGVSDLVGRFNTVSGVMEFAPNGNSRVEVDIDTASVDTNHQKRDDHLRSPDFLNVKQFPTMKFRSSKVHYSGSGEPSKIDGTLALHGETRNVSLDVKPVGAGKDPWGGYRAGYNATVTIKRSDYGMNYMPGGIGENIAISLNLEVIKN